MTKNLDSDGLKSIAENYDLFYIDLWGVIHNGIKLHEGAIFTLKKLLEINKDFIFLVSSTSPRGKTIDFFKFDKFSFNSLFKVGDLNSF